MGKNITIFQINPLNLEKWIHQNQAEYTGDYVEGVLLDNFILQCKNGYAVFYEKEQNEWTSIYEVEFQRANANDVFDRWYRFIDEYREVA